MNKHKQFILKQMRGSRPDNFYRAQAAFRGLSDDQMNEQYGQSGRTRREILEGYREHLTEWDAAIAWLEGVSNERE